MREKHPNSLTPSNNATYYCDKISCCLNICSKHHFEKKAYSLGFKDFDKVEVNNVLKNWKAGHS